MYSLLNTLSEYTYFYISKTITFYNFCLYLKSSKGFSVSLSKGISNIYLKVTTIEKNWRSQNFDFLS